MKKFEKGNLLSKERNSNNFDDDVAFSAKHSYVV